MIKQNQTLLNRVNVLLDGMLLVLALVMSYFLRFRFFAGAENPLELGAYLRYFLPFIPFQLLFYGFGGLYASGRRQTLKRSLTLIGLVNTAVFVVELSGMYLFKLLDLSRLALGFYYLMGLLFVGGKHVLTRKALERLRAEGHNLKHVVIVGSGPNALSYLNEIEKRPEYGFSYIGYVADEQILPGTWLGGFDKLAQVLTKTAPDEVICALDASELWF